MAATDALSALMAPNASSSTKPRDRLGQESFLQLMIAQFKNQDPTKPKDPSEFLGQLAQFSTVTGIQDMQTSLTSLADSLRSSNVLGGAVLVGREVLAPHATVAVAAGETISGAIDVPEGVSTMEIAIKDATGQLVRTVTVTGAQINAGGMSEFAWDGITDRGAVADAGTYSITATARVGAASESLPVLINTRVNSVTIDPQTNGLVLNTRGLGSISINDVRRVI
ncbi:MAG: flagellar hook assembly protein FlgD [Candidatus Obscuribacterales bacterium]|nr:flagellar hook assembly protein FlgD [Steroidobacteraceae bacterium]